MLRARLRHHLICRRRRHFGTATARPNQSSNLVVGAPFLARARLLLRLSLLLLSLLLTAAGAHLPGPEGTRLSRTEARRPRRLRFGSGPELTCAHWSSWPTNLWPGARVCAASPSSFADWQSHSRSGT